MSADTERTMKTIRPFLGRVTLIESAVEEAQRDSGIVVPYNTIDGDDPICRGVVLETHTEGTQFASVADVLSPGTVVYYRGGVRIVDVVIVDVPDIIGYET